jgi:hypothetical protein
MKLNNLLSNRWKMLKTLRRRKLNRSTNKNPEKRRTSMMKEM